MAKSSKSPSPNRRPRIRPIRAVRTRDADIRAVLLETLRSQFNRPDHDLILEEFGCSTARIDIAVVNGALHGFEIKSDSDTVDRLQNQVVEYSKVFDYVTLICGRRLLVDARALIPKWWGLQMADTTDGNLRLRGLRGGKKNPQQDCSALARMLWKNEALGVLRGRGIRSVSSRHTAEEVWLEIARMLDASTLADEVRDAIRARGGSGFAKMQAPDDGSCTTGSIAVADHYSANLAWLLSQLSGNLPD